MSTADRLVAGDELTLYTKMKVLDRMNKYKDCYAVCNRLIEMNFKVLFNELLHNSSFMSNKCLYSKDLDHFFVSQLFRDLNLL